MLELKISIEGVQQTINSPSPSILGRAPESVIRIDGSRFPTVSWVHAELERQGQEYWIVHRSKSNPTLINDQIVETKARLKPGDLVRLGATGPAIVILTLGDQAIAAEATMMARRSDTKRESLPQKIVELRDGLVLGRDQDVGEGQLEHVHVSKRHALIRLVNQQWIIQDLGSTNGTFVNGQRLQGRVPLGQKDIIDIGPFALLVEGRQLRSQSRANNIELSCLDLTKQVSVGLTGKLTLLEDISFAIKPGNFLCLLGPSGSGKSTLLGALSGRSAVSSGQVTVNSRNLHQNFQALKEDIVVVPQTTELYFALRVEKALSYTAALRLPADATRSEKTMALDRVIETVGIGERRTVPIRNLSGGQLKRVGLATELISDPSLLFLDEVTSGLDERSDQEMMELFRSLAEAGKTVVCVTHNLGNVDKYAHLVAILTAGGRLAFLGTPSAAKKHFGVESLADIYEALDQREPQAWAERFTQTPEYRTYHPNPNTIPPVVDSQNSKPPSKFFSKLVRQTPILAMRSLQLWRCDFLALISLVGQAVLVGLLICIVFGQVGETLTDPIQEAERLVKIKNLLFLLAVSVFWLGCNNSAKELVKERRIFSRERDFNLLPESYLLSKFFVMSLIGIVQVFVLGTLVFCWTEFPGGWLVQLSNLLWLSLSGTALGMAISSLAKSEETAIALVPVTVIPQIILSGVVAKLPSFAQLLAKLFITVFWGHHAAMNLPKEHRLEDEFEPSLPICWLVILLHSLLFVTTTWLATRWQRRT